MSEYTIKYPILLKPSHLETISQAWDSVAAELLEVGVVKGWLSHEGREISYACLMWQDIEYWNSYKNHGVKTPMSMLTERLDKWALIGYYDPIEPPPPLAQKLTVIRAN